MMHSLRPLSLGIGILILTLTASTLLGQGTQPRITFSKTLKGSTPEYFALKIDAQGKGTYDAHKLDDPPAPRPLQISERTTGQIFSLAHALNDFRSDLDSHRKVADMGMKTFVYEGAGPSHTVRFNYSENRLAQQLADLMEKIGNVEERIAQLEYAMKYDHLNLPQLLAQIAYGLENGYFVEADLMLPTLGRIAKDPRYLHLAQSRARECEERIRKGK